MNKFQIIQPSLLLSPYIKQYWFLTIKSTEPITQRLVPFGCSALSFYRGYRTYSLSENNYLPQSHLYGIATDYVDIRLSGNIDFIAIVFQPAGANAFFSMPLNELNNKYISLSALNDRGLIDLEDKLYTTLGNRTCVALIEQFLFDRIYKLDKYKEKRITAVINSIQQGETDINRLAETTCLSYKQFQRIFLENVGTNPKTYLQITRFGKLHHLLQQHTGLTLEQLSERCGYYDKSHLIKELKEYSGFLPSEMEIVCDPVYSDYHSLFRSAFIDLPSK